MPDSVIGNIQEFDSCVMGSNPVPVTDGSCSLFGKAPGCELGEQGSIPAATHNWFIVQWIKNTVLRTQK
jgi:hypothetical protein